MISFEGKPRFWWTEPPAWARRPPREWTSFREMPSGAAHDTICDAAHCRSAMVFVPCTDGISTHHWSRPPSQPKSRLPRPARR